MKVRECQRSQTSEYQVIRECTPNVCEHVTLKFPIGLQKQDDLAARIQIALRNKVGGGNKRDEKNN